MVEFQPSKLVVRVRFPSPAPLQDDLPNGRFFTIIYYASLAQMDRVVVFETIGRAFESPMGHQIVHCRGIEKSLKTFKNKRFKGFFMCSLKYTFQLYDLYLPLLEIFLKHKKRG